MNQVNRLVTIVVLSIVSVCGRAAADGPGQSAVATTSAQSTPSTRSQLSWLTAYHFHLAAASIRTADPRFDWDAHLGGDVDVLDYGAGRVNVLADYGVVIGSEFRTIDPNQGAYHLEVSSSLRSGNSEFQAVFRHVSRHLSDRANRTAVAWNLVGLAATARYAAGSTDMTVTIEGGKAVQAAFVDYTWQFATRVAAECRISSSVSLIARGEVVPTLVNQSIAGRSTQTAGTVEAGVRLSGKGAAVELFAAWERRLDPYPLERGIGTWALLGLRLVNR